MKAKSELGIVRPLPMAPTSQIPGTQMNILVRNLARSTSKEQLMALFAPFGRIESCELVLDKDTLKSKGFGFVAMAKDKDAKAAIVALNGEEVDGKRIRVKRAKPKSEGVNAPDAPGEGDNAWAKPDA